MIDEDEINAISELKQMSREELEKVTHETIKWICQCKNCNNGTHIWDFGIEPIYYHPRKTILWFDINYTYWMCSKHYPFIKKLRNRFSEEHIQRRLMDFSKEIIKHSRL